MVNKESRFELASKSFRPLGSYLLINYYFFVFRNTRKAIRRRKILWIAMTHYIHYIIISSIGMKKSDTERETKHVEEEIKWEQETRRIFLVKIERAAYPIMNPCERNEKKNWRAWNMNKTPHSVKQHFFFLLYFFSLLNISSEW